MTELIKRYEEMVDWLQVKCDEYSYRKVAEVIGVHHALVYRICYGVVKNPRLDTLVKIEKAMNGGQL